MILHSPPEVSEKVSQIPRILATSFLRNLPRTTRLNQKYWRDRTDPTLLHFLHEGIEMSHAESETQITMCCPSGHRVRGGTELLGRSVRCPKCQTPFVFAAEKPRPAPAVRPHPMSDTGVMRILGDMSVSSLTQMDSEVAFRPCSRCGVTIPETMAVCSHCNCYVGVMPTFMKQMSGNIPQRS